MCGSRKAPKPPPPPEPPAPLVSPDYIEKKSASPAKRRKRTGVSALTIPKDDTAQVGLNVNQ